MWIFVELPVILFYIVFSSFCLQTLFNCVKCFSKQGYPAAYAPLLYLTLSGVAVVQRRRRLFRRKGARRTAAWLIATVSLRTTRQNFTFFIPEQTIWVCLTTVINWSRTATAIQRWLILIMLCHFVWVNRLTGVCSSSENVILASLSKAVIGV